MTCGVIYLNILMWKYNLITNNNNQKLKKYQNSWRCSPHCCPFGQYFPKGWYCPYKFPVGNRSMFELSQHIPTFGQYFPKGWYCPYKFPAGNRSMFELYQHIPTFFLSALFFLLFPTILIPPPPNFPQTSIYCVLFLNSLKKPPLPSQLISTSDYLKHERNVDPWSLILDDQLICSTINCFIVYLWLYRLIR